MVSAVLRIGRPLVIGIVLISVIGALAFAFVAFWNSSNDSTQGQAIIRGWIGACPVRYTDISENLVVQLTHHDGRIARSERLKADIHAGDFRGFIDWRVEPGNYVLTVTSYDSSGKALHSAPDPIHARASEVSNVSYHPGCGM
jgi:hypothetical protein